MDRDTQKFALKCSYAIVNGKEVNVEKSPTEMDKNGNITGSFKKSKGGKLKLIQVDGVYKTVQQTTHPEFKDELITVFENGVLTHQFNFEEIRTLVNTKI